MSAIVPPAPSPDRPDVLIVGARVIDGTGNPWRYGDVALAGDRIAAVAPPGRLDRAAAGEVVEADGLVVCPGFIDIQSHSIAVFMLDRRSLGKVTQGVTTEIMGESWTPAPFGGQIADPLSGGLRTYLGEAFDEWDERARGWTRFGDWLADLEGRGVSVNVGSFIGGGTVREWGKGEAMGAPSPDELDAMRDCLDAAMRDGAFGIATALIYPPGSYAGLDELVALNEVVHRHRGVHITHVRSEESRLLEAIDEAVTIARRTGVATEIYHLKAAGPRNWPLMPEAIARIDAARAEGLDVTADMYPYEAAGTGLAVGVPPWAAEDGRLVENLRDPATRARIAAEIRHPSEPWENLVEIAGPENVLVAGPSHPDLVAYRGRRLSEVAAARGQDWVDALLDLLATEGSNIFAMFFMMSEENLALQMRQPWVTIATDAGGLDPVDAVRRGLTHPRAYGTYPRVLGRYVRERGALPLEDAIRKMSSAVADRLGLRDRGLLRTGMLADVVLFDPETVSDRATWTEPHQLSVGVRDVWVNGERVVRDGGHTGALPGRRVFGPGHRAAER
ncbi:MAG: N-acyl-D-amino-acid deacylase [uncultured Thermomicrobiales bacterium]|uniref:N-acyl-D-amino-acid deacylase n=1 Tax=uncultured Thermomicrobiales bacterium TaxID=1645740 RepID=A0A6J4UH57_9BACT|nr:MAG: N-acyl-D-amino-acid deacylase [uncultured Thermomicrobiales bacterium]